MIRLGDAVVGFACLLTGRRACGAKVRHSTALGALAQIDQLYGARRADAGTLRSYRCHYCAGWHVGHRPKKGATP